MKSIACVLAWPLACAAALAAWHGVVVMAGRAIGRALQGLDGNDV